jgi:hypothetical protein
MDERAGRVMNLQPQMFDRTLGREPQAPRFVGARRQSFALRKGRQREGEREKDQEE